MLRGNLEIVSERRIAGWAQDLACPDVPVSLLITAGDVLVARVLADIYRPDLQSAGIGSGRHSFDFKLGADLPPLPASLIRVFRESDAADLDNSPFQFEPSPAFTDGVRQCIIAMLATDDTTGALTERIAFLAKQTGLLLQRLAEQQGGQLEARSHRDTLRRWSWRAPDNADVPPPPPTRHALVIDHTMPTTNVDAGSCAVVSHMRSLQRLGYCVSFVAADMSESQSVDLLEAGIEICGIPFHASVEEVLHRRGSNLDLVYLHRASVAFRYLPLARHHCPRARIIYSVADLHHLRLQRQSEVQRVPELLATSRRVRQEEFSTARAADIVITHSRIEAELLGGVLPAGRVQVVPWSVQTRCTAIPAKQRQGVAFIGSHAHAPNRDAVFWLVEEIMPLVWQHSPTIECFVVGMGVPSDVTSSRDPRVKVIGHVPCLASVFDRVRLTVAPLAFGAGLKGKVIDSFAAGVPCICTPVAAEGLELPPSLAALIGQTTEKIADLIVSLHTAPEHVDTCGADGLAFAQRSFSEAEVDLRMARALAHGGERKLRST